MTDLQIVSWEEDNVTMESADYDTDLLGSTAAVETEAMLCSRLVPRLCEQRDVAALKRLAETLSEIPEQNLVEMVLTVLDADDTPERVSAMEALLRRPFTPAALTSSLRRRNSSDVISLTGHVTDLLRSADDDLTAVLVEWLAALLDSQYPGIVSSEDQQVHQLLGSITEWRDQQERATQEASLLLRQLDHMQALRHHPPSPPAADYSVMVLNL